MTAIPLAPLPDDIAEHVERLGAKQVNLYRCLAHAPGAAARVDRLRVGPARATRRPSAACAS